MAHARLAEHYDDLLRAVQLRRRHAGLRALAAFFIAGLGYLLTHWTWLGGWAGLYALAQGLELWVFRPSRTAFWSRPSAGRIIAMLAVFTLPAAIYVSIAWPLWQDGGRYGMATAALLLAGGGLNLITMSAGSALAFGTPFSLYIVVWLGAILTDPTADPAYRAITVASAALVIINCVLTWRLSAQALAKEKAAAAEIEARRAQAQAAVDAKSALVAMLGHELRTPIGAIVAGAEQLEREAPSSARAHARMVREAGVMMADLLGDLLDLARLDAGALPIERIAFDLRADIAQTLRLWRAQAQAQGLRLSVSGARSLPGAVFGDPTRLRQILNNLISNAIKFTPSGGVALSLALRDGRLLVQVDDTGPGFGEVELERLFVPYDQIHAAVPRRHGGAGLGLAISRSLARRMGGDLIAGRSPGGGARLSLTLPLESAATPESLAGRRALVVDDHPLSRQALETALTAMGLQVAGVANGRAGLDRLRDEGFDLVLMDLHMPGLDGAETARLMRARPGAPPIIAVTASESVQDQEACRSAGMMGPLIKPLDPARLVSLLHQAAA